VRRRIAKSSRKQALFVKFWNQTATLDSIFALEEHQFAAERFGMADDVEASSGQLHVVLERVNLIKNVKRYAKRRHR
jgi:hypothetical protein